MKGIILMIVLGFGLSGCGLLVGGVALIADNAEKDKRAGIEKAKAELTINAFNAQLACYKLSGASEVNIKVDTNNFKWLTDNNAKIDEIVEAKASKNGSKEQIEQCTEQIQTIMKSNKCDGQNQSCYEKVNKELIAYIESISPQLKNVKFTCSQEYEVLKAYGPKFDKDIEQYALDLIKFKPIVSKDIAIDISKNITKDLETNLFNDINKQETDELIKIVRNTISNAPKCVYKMQYYGGNLNDLDDFKKSGTLADSIAKGYGEFKGNIETQNDEVANAAIVTPNDNYTIRALESPEKLFMANVMEQRITIGLFKIKEINWAVSPATIQKELAQVNQHIKEYQNFYNGLSKQERPQYYTSRNMEIAKLIVKRKQYEAMLKFLKED